MSHLTQISRSDFQEKVINSDRPVLVDFYADWCGPCRAQTPVLEKLAGEYQDQIHVVKINVDQEAELSNRFNVRSIPTLVLFKGGEAIGVQVGMASAQQLKEVIEKSL